MRRWQLDAEALSGNRATPLSEAEYETVKRFGLHKRAVSDVLGMRFGLGIVAAFILALIVVVVLVVLL